MPTPRILRAYSPLIVLGGLAVFAPLIEGGTTQLPVLIIRLSLIVTFAVWVLASMKSGRLILPRSRLFIVVALFLGWAALSVARSPYMAVSLHWLISILSYAALLFLVLQLVESISQVRSLVVVILGMGFFEAAVGIYQFLWGGQPRATGTFFNPNFFATYEAAVFAVTFGLLCYGQWGEAARWEKPVLWFTAGVVGVAFVLAQSRGALLAFIVAVTFIGLHRFGKAFLAVLLLGLAAIVIVPNPLQQRVMIVGAQDPYAFTRMDIWKNSFQRIADHPWGVGPGLYKYTSFRYRFPIEGSIAQYGKRAESAHNEYLQMAVELGVAGVAIFLAGIGFVGWTIRETLSLALEPWERSVVTGLAGGILGILVHGMVDSAFHEPALVLLLCTFTGLILVLHRKRAADSTVVLEVPFPYRPARVVLVVVLAALLGLLVIRPAAAWYAFDKGERERTVGQEGRALEWFERATRIDPGTTTYHDAVALSEVRLYHQSGDPRWLLKAVEALSVSLVLNPLDARFASRLGAIHVLLADHAGGEEERAARLGKAADYYEQAMQLDPYSPFNYLELGKLRWAQRRVDEAQAWFRRATSYEPNFLPARVRLAELFLQTGHKEVALLEYTESMKIQERYRGRTLNSLERQYLDVDLDHVKDALTLAGAL